MALRAITQERLSSSTPAYCEQRENRYLFFADRPIFGVTLVAGPRREMLPASRLYAAAIDTPTRALNH